MILFGGQRIGKLLARGQRPTAEEILAELDLVFEDPLARQRAGDQFRALAMKDMTLREFINRFRSLAAIANILPTDRIDEFRARLTPALKRQFADTEFASSTI